MPPAACAGLVAFAAVSGACGYRFAAAPELPGGARAISLGAVENETAEPEAGALVRDHLGRRAAAAGALGESEVRLAGRVVRVRAQPEAFPGAVGSAGLYALSMEAEAWIEGAGGRRLHRVRASGSEPFYAGRDAAETESNRRRALERLAERLAQRLWLRLVRPE